MDYTKAEEDFKRSVETGDPEGDYLMQVIDGLFKRMGIRFSVKDKCYDGEKYTFFFHAFDSEEDERKDNYAVRLEITYFPKTGNTIPEVWINTIFLNHSHQRRGIASSILHVLCLYRDHTHRRNCHVCIFNIANSSWKEYLISKGAVCDGDDNILITNDPAKA